MSIFYWILAGVGSFSLLLIIWRIFPALADFIVEVFCEILENIGDD